MAKTDFGSVELTDSGAFLKIGATSMVEADVSNITVALPLIKGAGRVPKVAVVPLAAVDTAGGLFSWANPEATAILITKVVLDVTTAATGACSASIGQTATSGTTLSANLIDTLDVHTAIGTFDNITDKGTNGKSRQKVAVGKWVTGSTASGASAGIVGNAYIEYILV